jgi:hypothetical protein
MDLPIGHQRSKTEFWHNHIKAAESFDGTLKEYCQQHKINAGSMSAYRTRLGYSKTRRQVKSKEKSKFIPVTAPSLPSREARVSSLPDPKWLAQFLRAWYEQ